MASTASKSASFTFIWTIENISELIFIDLKSRVFFPRSICDADFYIQIDESVDFCCYLLQNEELFAEFEKSEIDIEFSFLAADGSPIISKEIDKTNMAAKMATASVYIKRRSEFMPNNTLTIQCRMWRTGYDISTADFGYASTMLRTYRKSIIWEIKEFNSLPCSTTEDFNQLGMDEKRVYPIKRFFPESPYMSLILYLKRNSGYDSVNVDLLLVKGKDYAFGCEISVLDINGKVIASKIEKGRTFFSWAILNFWPLISKNELMTNKNLLLPNGNLILRVSFEICIRSDSNRIEYSTPNVKLDLKYYYDDNYDAIREMLEPLKFEEYFTKEEDYDDSLFYSRKRKNVTNSCSDSCPLKEMLSSLYSDSSLGDINLQLGTKLYPAHKNILSSRSPVFKKMLNNHIMTKTLKIEDMDENTLCRLLKYIYTDTVKDFAIGSILDLYKAADDYQLMDLRYKCSNFLRMHMCKNNICDILSLAKKCQDKKLEEDALRHQEYLKERDEIWNQKLAAADK